VGSIFKLEIPIKKTEAAPEAVETKRLRVIGIRPGLPKYRILIADDDEDNLSLMDMTLRKVGFETRLATNGEAAIREFKKWHPHLILTDMHMPRMDGFEAIRKIRTLPGGKEVKIIGVSASAFDDARRKVINCGADDYFSKPYKEIDLFEILAKYLKVEYLFESETVFTEPLQWESDEIFNYESLAGLSPELLIQMENAITSADLYKMLDLIDEAADLDTKTANGLRELTKNYRYDKLIEILRGVNASNENK
jgi:CheY-like chemotaxis protein